MKKKPGTTGLAAFAKKTKTKSSQTKQTQERKRGKGSTVGITVRLARGDWERLHHLAVSEGQSLQALALKGFSMVLGEKGLPAMGD